jgi:hypothetical protein
VGKQINTVSSMNFKITNGIFICQVQSGFLFILTSGFGVLNAFSPCF